MLDMILYTDRKDAGKCLAQRLLKENLINPIVLAIPNGGVIVGLEIAKALNCSLELIVVKKLPIPKNPEAGFGAIAHDNTLILNRVLIDELEISEEKIQELVKDVLKKIKERLEGYGIKNEFPYIKDKTAILVDDGLASGVTMEAAISIINKYRPKSIIVAVPTASGYAFGKISPLVYKIVCPDVRRHPHFSVATVYQFWHDVSDNEVKTLLNMEGRCI